MSLYLNRVAAYIPGNAVWKITCSLWPLKMPTLRMSYN